MANATHSGETHYAGQNAEIFEGRNLRIYMGMATRETFSRSRCQHGTAVFAVACPFFGTKEKCRARILSELGGVKVQYGAYAESRTIPSL
jgi:hypothetical protein